MSTDALPLLLAPKLADPNPFSELAIAIVLPDIPSVMYSSRWLGNVF